MNGSIAVGVIAALLAACAWSTNFVVPFVIGDYSIFDFMLFRFFVSGVIGFGLLTFRPGNLRSLTLQDWLMAAWLGFIGYVGFFLTVTGAAIYAGPVIAPAFLSMVPVALAIAGNMRQRTLPWRRLSPPLVLVAVGLALINGSILGEHGAVPARSIVTGVMFAITAVASWTWFGLLNQSELARRPKLGANTWAALIMTAAGMEVIAFVPVGLRLGVFKIPELGLHWETASSLYVWGIASALLSSVFGAVAWTVATRRLPVALAGQLIVMETVFGTIFGLAVQGKAPTLGESAGMLILIVGVVIAIRIFHHQRARVQAI